MCELVGESVGLSVGDFVGEFVELWVLQNVSHEIGHKTNNSCPFFRFSSENFFFLICLQEVLFFSFLIPFTLNSPFLSRHDSVGDDVGDSVATSMNSVGDVVGACVLHALQDFWHTSNTLEPFWRLLPQNPFSSSVLQFFLLLMPLTLIFLLLVSLHSLSTLVGAYVCHVLQDFEHTSNTFFPFGKILSQNPFSPIVL